MVESTLGARMAGEYQPPILVEPKGGPIPTGITAAAPAPDPQTAELQQQWVQAQQDILGDWPDTAQPMVDDLTNQVQQVGAGDDLGTLGALTVSAVVVAAIALVLTKKASKVAALAAAGVVAGAATQGVRIEAPAGAGEYRVRQTADAYAHLIASAYASAAGRTALQLIGSAPADVRAALLARLTDLGAAPTGVVADHIGALLSAAQHAGRLAVLTQHPAAGYEAVESNDRARCEPCATVDHTRYETLKDALVDYPISGFRSCLGGLRCRGHIRAIWT